jgi:two-component system, LytTR family, sensor kinase
MNNAFLMDWNRGWKLKIYDNIIPHFFLVIAGAAIKLMIDAARMQKRIAAMAKEKAEAELEFLKQQINPHFLFNSLNTVYFQIDKSNTEARATLHQLSELLRYQLYETGESTIPIEKEIKYLQDYIALQKMRKEEHYKISFQVSASAKGFLIEPFLLIPFVENCFKHVSHYQEKENTIAFSLDYRNSVFFFTATNSTAPPVVNPKRTGIGLPNVKRRLELLYPGRHKLCIEHTAGNYTVALQLKINEHGYS